MRKIFSILQPASGWTNSTRSVVGVEVRGLNLSISILSGANLHEASFVALLRGPLAGPLREAAKYVRKNPVRIEIERGMSGRRAFIIHWTERIGSFFRPRRKEVLYISGTDKIAHVDCFLPDLVLFLPNLRSYDDPVDIREVPEIDRQAYCWVQRHEADELVEHFLVGVNEHESLDRKI